MPGRIRAGEGTLIGNAAEYYVVAELLSRGIIAALAPRNAPDVDILAAQRNARKTVRIRVKSKSEPHNDWQWVIKKDGTILRNIFESGDFVILVNLKGECQRPDFYIVPTASVDCWLRETFDKWVAAPGKNGRPHDPTNKKRHLTYSHYKEQLAEFKEDWDSLWTNS
ncbi:MAG: hypothetical protein GTN93_30575 [Anaerolineae bacterium]|nr:hypothetical protein [Anaerolineae bacterium]